MWFKVDDGFHGHPKVVDLSLEAVGLWTLAGSWCAQYLTDGLFPSKALRRLGGSEGLASELVEAGLWEAAEGGWQFKDWTDYQPSKAEVEAERDAARERMKKVRAAKKGVTRSGEQPANVRANKSRSSEEVRSTRPARPARPASPPPSNEGGGADAPLSPFCKRHPKGTDDPCGACGTARTAYEAAQKHKPTPKPFTVVPGALCADGRHKLLADGTCTLCEYRGEIAS